MSRSIISFIIITIRFYKKQQKRYIMNVFDILGPVMIGPSSSHTAGAARIGLVTRALLGKTPVKAHIFLHGSFAKTYKGHGTDKALVAGILGMQTDDERIRFFPGCSEAGRPGNSD